MLFAKIARLLKNVAVPHVSLAANTASESTKLPTEAESSFTAPTRPQEVKQLSLRIRLLNRWKYGALAYWPSEARKRLEAGNSLASEALERAAPWLIFLIAFAVISLVAHGRSTIYSHDVRLAYAWLRESWRPYCDSASKWGLDYCEGTKGVVVEPPFPALLVLPFVVIYGTQANQTFVAIIVGALCISLSWILFCRIGLRRTHRLWLCAFALLGLPILWCAELGDAWLLAHLAGFALTTGCLIEILGKRRWWLVGLLSSLAFETRTTMVLALPLYLVLAGKRWWQLLPFAAVGSLAFVGTNELIWGSPFNQGYNVFFHLDPWGQKIGSPFSLSYLPYEVWSFFAQPPQLVEELHRAKWPFFSIPYTGVALTWSSPALLLALWAKDDPEHPNIPPVWFLWATVVLLFLPSLFYYSDGWTQAEMRHAMDFEPFLLLLMAMSLRNGMSRPALALLTYSSAFGIWAVWYWNLVFRTSNN